MATKQTVAKREMKGRLSVLLVFSIVAIGIQLDSSAQQQDEDVSAEHTEIVELLQQQADAWNRGDIDTFMTTYWNSPELTFSSGGTTTRGWQQTLDRYKARYDTPEKMGQLDFDGIEFQLLSPDVALLLGNWKLTLDEGAPHGNFSLVVQRIDGEWKIIHDHSSTNDSEEESE